MGSKSSHAGFTLIELLVSMLLTGIIMAAVYNVYRMQTRSVKVQENRLEAQEYARAVLDIMVREIRNAGYNPTSATAGNDCGGVGVPGTPGVITANEQIFHFSYDLDNNGHCSSANENTRYAFDTGTCPAGFGDITRQDGSNAAQPLTDCNVPEGTANFSFRYYVQNSTEAITPVPVVLTGSIQRVEIELVVQSKNPDPEFGGQLNARMTSNVDLRNRGLPP